MTDTDPINAPVHDPYLAFRTSNFWRYMLGSMLIQIGMGAQGTAIAWEIYVRTGKPLALGLVGGVQALPMILLSLPGGYLADRFDRRRIIAVCLSGVALCSLGLAWLSAVKGPILWMYVLLMLDAALMTLERPAGASILPTLVPLDAFENAMKWRTSLQQVSGVAGPALGGAIILWRLPALLGHLPVVYLINTAFALVFIGLLFFLRMKPSPKTAGAPTLATVGAGVKFVWSRKVLLAAVSLDMFAVLLGGAVYLLPVYAKDILHAGAQGLGWLRAAPAVGAFCMAILMAHLPPMRRAGRSMLLAVAGFGLATIVFGLSRNFLLSWAMLFLTGAFDNISVVVRHTLIQLLTPDHMRGRVSAVNAIFIGSSNEVGGMESGLVAQAFTPTISVVSGGLGTLCIVALWALLFPRLRRFGQLTAAPEEELEALPIAETIP